MTASLRNIRSEYNNNKLKISKDDRRSWQTISFSNKIYDNDDINTFIHDKMGKVIGKDIYGLDILFHLTTYKVFIR